MVFYFFLFLVIVIIVIIFGSILDEKQKQTKLAVPRSSEIKVCRLVEHGPKQLKNYFHNFQI